MSLLISEAFAAATAPGPQAAQSPYGQFLIIFAMLAVAYFLLIRPQTKRAKEHRELVTSLAKGDEVVTLGGMLGKISKITDQYIVLSVGNGVEIPFKRESVSQVLVKGTIQSI